MKKTVCFLPARGLEDNLKNKNLQVFSGEPLFIFTLRKLLSCDFIDEVYVDTNDANIKYLAESIGSKVLDRPKNLAGKDIDGHMLFLFETSQVEADIYIQILCTYPFIETDTIKNALHILNNKYDYDSVVLMRQDFLYQWKNEAPTYNQDKIPNKTDIFPTFSELMGLYVINSGAVKKTKRRIGEKPYLLLGKPIETIAVNTPEELILAEYVAKGIKSDEIKYFNLLKIFLSSPILSDICDELNLNCVLPAKYSSNIPRAKIFGRAKTLKLRKSTDNDQPDAIYEALHSYNYVTQNDIIVVGTDCPELAYFGDLNMSLAIRAGASGALIGGVTRDNARTSSAGFPVFAQGRYCKDIKSKGAVEGINIPIVLDGIKIDFGDLIFGDEDGIVVIPRKNEDAILKKSIKLVSSESKIISSILNNVSTSSLVEKHGFF